MTLQELGRVVGRLMSEGGETHYYCLYALDLSPPKIHILRYGCNRNTVLAAGEGDLRPLYLKTRATDAGPDPEATEAELIMWLVENGVVGAEATAAYKDLIRRIVALGPLRCQEIQERP